MKVLLVGSSPICTCCGLVMHIADRVDHKAGTATVFCGMRWCGNHGKAVSVTFPVVEARAVYPEGM